MTSILYMLFGLYGGVVLSNLLNINQIANPYDKAIVFFIIEIISLIFSFFLKEKMNNKLFFKKKLKLRYVFNTVMLSIVISFIMTNSLMKGLILFIYFLILLYLIFSLLQNKYDNKKINIIINEAVYFLILSNGGYYDLLTTIIGILIIYFISIVYFDVKIKKDVYKYYTNINKLLLGLITVLTSFSLYGNELILTNNLVQGFILPVLICQVIYQAILIILYYLEEGIKTKRKKEAKIKDLDKKERFASNTILIIVSCLIAVVGCLILDDYVIKEYKDTNIYLEATGKTGKIIDGNEVFLDKIQTANGDYKFKGLKTAENWNVLKNNTSIVYHNSNKKSIQKIKIKKTRTARMYFTMSKINGTLIIHDGDKSIKKDLSSNDNAYANNYFVYNVTSNVKNQNVFVLSLKYGITFLMLFGISFGIIKLLYMNKLKHNTIYNLYLQRKSFLTIFTIVFSLMMIALIAYYPGNLSWDNLYQYQQALGMSEIDNGHPVIMTLFMKLILKINTSMFLISTSLILLISLIITTLLNYLHHKGISKKTIITIAIVFCVMPNTIMMSTNFLKDVPQAYLILLLTYFIYLICSNNKEFSDNIYYLILLPITISVVGLLRHEMMFICYIIILFLVIYSLKKRNKKILFFTLLSIILITGFDYCINKRYNLNSSSEIGDAYIFPAKGLASVLASNKTLSNVSKKYLLNGMSLKKWKENYEPYNIDSLSFNQSLDSKIKEKGLALPVKCYFIEFIHHPYIIFKDRLNSTDIMWNAHTNKGRGEFKYYDGIMTFYMIGPKEFGLKAKNSAWKSSSKITSIYRNYINELQKYEIFNMIFWRAGIYLAILLIVILYLINNKKIQLFTLIPIIGKTLLWCILLGCQHYRYVYYLSLIIPFIVMTILVKEKKNGKS